MIRAGHLTPHLISSFFPVGPVGRTSDCILVPLRLAAVGLHALAALTIWFDRSELLRLSLNDPHTDAEYRDVDNTLNMALAGTFISLIAVTAPLLNGRLLLSRYAALHAINFACHTVAGILLFVSWARRLHVVRVMHITVVFNLIPAIVTMIFRIQSKMSGTFI